MADHDIDFERAATLLDVVQKVSTVAPGYMALSGVAMAELKDMNKQGIDYLAELGQERLREEQAQAAKIDAQNQAYAEETAKADREIAKRQAATPKPIAIMPGEPVPARVQIATGDIQKPSEDHDADGIADQQQTEVVERRV